MSRDFLEILETLGARDTQLSDESSDWSFFTALYRTPAGVVPANYLYLKSGCPLKRATDRNQQHWRGLSGGRSYNVVVTPKSPLAADLKSTNRAFGGTSATTSKQLLLDNFVSEFRWREVGTVDPFIEPTLETRNRSSVPRAVTYLRDWLAGQSADQSQNSIAVLIADGGVGKTTVARVLCHRLRKHDPTSLPLLVESNQWQHLLQTPFTLGAIWNLAISRRFEHATRLLDNETALKVLVREGLFVVIFDGFDELCVSPSAPFKPKDVVDELVQLVSSEESAPRSRILLTVRESFWKELEEELDPSRVDIFRLKSFDNEQRKDFFAARLTDSSERNIAERISRQIGGALYPNIDRTDTNRDRLSGVPFVLDLIAHYVSGNKEAGELKDNPYVADPLHHLLGDVCRRENVRQSLDIDAARQLDFFGELFREYPETVQGDDLKLYLQVVCGVTDQAVMQRFTNHVFLSRAGKDAFRPRYEVLRVYFIARFLAHSLRLMTTSPDVKKIARMLAENSTGKTQVLDWVVEQLALLDPTERLAAVHHALKIVKEGAAREYQRHSSMAIFHILARLVKETADKSDRAAALAQYLGRTASDGTLKFEDVTLTGALRAYDFSRSEFKNCALIDVEFRNCRFSSATSFFGCNFEGTLSFQTCDNAPEIRVAGESCSGEAEYVLNEIRQAPTREATRRKFAEEVLGRALKRFRGDFGVRPVKFAHRTTGLKAGNPYNDEIWDALESAGIVERHLIANVADGGLSIVDKKEIRRELANFFDNGVLGPRLRQVVDELVRRRAT